MGKFETSREYREWNDEMIRRHDPAAYYRSPLVRALEGFRLRAILSGVRLASGRRRFLELGCGFGFVLKRVAAQGGFTELYGGDLSRPSLLSAAAQTPQGIGLALCDATAPPFRGATMDAICITEVLEHVPDPVGVLRAAGGLLAPGGVLIVTAPNEPLINRLKTLLRKSGLWGLFFGAYDAADHMEDEWHLHAADRDALRGWISEAGLREVRLSGLPFGWLPTRYLAVCARP